MTEPPRPDREDAYHLVETAKFGGLHLVLNTIDNRLTSHYRQQMAILAMPTDEVIDRLTNKMYVTQRELQRI